MLIFILRVFFLLILLHCKMYAAFTTYYGQATLANGESVNGHAYFQAGAIIGTTNTGVVAFNTAGNLDGVVSFNTAGGSAAGSRIILENDLTLGSTAKLTNPSSAAVIQSRGASLKLTGSLTLDNYLYVSGDVTVNGQGNVVTLDGVSSGFFLMYENSSSSTLRLKNMHLVVDNGNGVVNESQFDSVHAATFGTIELENVSITVLNGRTSLQNCYVSICGTVDIQGWGQEFMLQRIQVPSLIQAGAMLRVGPGVIFTGCKNNVNNSRSFLSCFDGSSIVWFDNCVVRTLSPGWVLRNGTVYFDGRVRVQNIDDIGTSPSYVENNNPLLSFELGNDGVNEIEAIVLPGAQVEVQGYLLHTPL